MISFMNDYSEGAHPRVLEYLMKYNSDQNKGYGLDVHSDRAKELIKDRIGRQDVDIHFISGGTQTNLLVISAFLRPHQCVIAAETGHINVHETGAIEATGHKVIAMASGDGKLTPALIQKAVDYHSDEHMVKPKMVYISNTTELGTIYQKEELLAIKEVCEKNGLYLFLDGARLASALTSGDNDLTIEVIAQTVDAFYIGGTKNGMLFGEALVLCNEGLKEEFRYLIKQRGALLAKGFVLGIQFVAVFEDNLYYEMGTHANQMARELAKIIENCGFAFYVPVCSNQLFPVLPNQVIDRLSEDVLFSVQEKIDEFHSTVRFVTSWATTTEMVQEFGEKLLQAK